MRNAGDPDCRPAVEIARRVGPLARGEVAALAIAESPLRVPDLAFHDLPAPSDGCRIGAAAPCCSICGRPGASRAARRCRRSTRSRDASAGERFEVVAVNIDTRDSDKPRAWLEEVGVNRLAYYADPSAKVFQDLKLVGRAFGMPTTLLVDPAGCEIGTAAGPAEWASEDGVKLVRAALGG